jgi:hypothetical protein
MLRTFFLAAAITSSMSFLPAIGAAPPKARAVVVAETEAIVELVSVDRDTRNIVVRGPTGAMLTIAVPPEAQNLDRVKPGDRFTVRYLKAVALALRKGGEAFASELQTVELAPQGGTPGGRVVNTKQVTAVVSEVDRPSRTLTVQGAQKERVSLRVADEVRGFDEIAVGDTIALTYTEAIAMKMTAPSSAPPTPEANR